jgi:hypothetical protein
VTVIDQDTTPDVSIDMRTIPGALDIQLVRELPDGSRIEFEQAPAGWLTQAGEIRKRDHRAYYVVPPVKRCDPCNGSGRVEGKTAKGKICPDCKGSGMHGRRQRLTSVTTILDGILPKPGLPPWSEARGIEGAIEAVRRGEIDPHDPASVERAVDTVRALRLGADRARDDAAQRGLNVHDLLRHFMETGEPPNPAEHPAEHYGYLRALTRWLLKANVEPIAVEELVANPAAGYAGRYDLCAKADGQVILFDAKTQERAGIYEAAHLQVELYRRAALASGDGEVDGTRIVVFAADGQYREMEGRADDALVEAALEFSRRLKPVTSACESANRIEREARKAVAA